MFIVVVIPLYFLVTTNGDISNKLFYASLAFGIGFLVVTITMIIHSEVYDK